MIGNFSDRQFIVVDEAVSLRKGFTGLFHHVSDKFGTVNFFNNVGYVFINRRRNMFKCIFWENGSLGIWHKRLTQGTLGKYSCDNTLISFSDLMLFLHGFIPPENVQK